MAQTIGFIGLGIMGRPMAKNLLKAGHPLVVHSRSQGPSRSSSGAGAKAADSPKDVAGQVRRAHHDAAELARRRAGGARPGRPHRGRQAAGSSSSTCRRSRRSSRRRSARRSAAKGVRCSTRPVSGGEKGAIDGALSIMVGGEQGRLRAALPVFQAMGKTITHLGPAGRGRLHQARQPDHRRREPDRARRGAHPGQEGGARPRAHAQGARRRARRARSASSRRRRTTSPAPTTRVQDRPALQGPRADHGLLARPRRAAAGDGGGAGAVQRHAREGPGRPRPLRASSRCSRSSRGCRSKHEGDGGPAGARLPGPLARSSRSAASARATSPRSATSSSRPSATSSSASWARARARSSAAPSTSTTAGSWSRGAASSPRKATARSSAPRWR